MSDIVIVPIQRLELAFAPRPWAFAVERRAEIDAHFIALKHAQPALWNGPILLLYEYAIEDGTFRGRCLETDFASMLAWRDWGFPNAGVKNFFAMGALRATDGAYLLGLMGRHTSNAGQVYFPSGTPDQDDIVGATVDLDRSIWREVAEETGLERADLDAAPDWTVVFAGPRIALMKRLQARQDADTLRRRILAQLADQQRPEFSDIRIARGPADFDANMPDFVTADLRHVWA